LLIVIPDFHFSKMICQQRLLSPGLIATLLLVVGGCATDSREAVNGKVFVDDAPLKHGTISFEPLTAEGRGAGCAVIDGSFQLPADKGLIPGQYLATIAGHRETGKIIKDYQRGDIPERVALKFQEPMPLQAMISSGEAVEFKLHQAK
jgi:hypothetical protein